MSEVPISEAETSPAAIEVTDLRAHGADLLERVRTARTPEEWSAMPASDQPFAWGTCWKHCVTVAVDDPERETGWFHTMLGFAPFAWDAEREYLMLSSADGALLLGIGRVRGDAPALTPGSMLLELMLEDIEGSAAELERRGVTLDEPVTAPWGEGHPMRTAWLTTPNGIRIRLWGMVAAS